jgi:hypothetical protein
MQKQHQSAGDQSSTLTQALISLRCCFCSSVRVVCADINSFDQFGVELGKKLADQVRKQMVASRAKDGKAAIDKQFNPSTAALLNRYFTAKL